MAGDVLPPTRMNATHWQIDSAPSSNAFSQKNSYFNRVWRQIEAMHYADLTHFQRKVAMMRLSNRRLDWSPKFQGSGHRCHMRNVKIPKFHAIYLSVIARKSNAQNERYTTRTYSADGWTSRSPLAFHRWSHGNARTQIFWVWTLSVLISNRKSPEPNFNAISFLFKQLFLLSDFAESAEKCSLVGQQYVTGPYTHTHTHKTIANNATKNYILIYSFLHNRICRSRFFETDGELNGGTQALIGLVRAMLQCLPFIHAFCAKCCYRKGLFFAKQKPMWLEWSNGLPKCRNNM